MEVTAKARYLRVSPKKVRLVIDVIRGMDVVPAQHELEHMRKDAKKYVSKLLDSSLANAEHNFELKRENLYVKEITADGGPILHRWRPRAHGRAGAIRKRTTHLTIVLAERVPTAKKTDKKQKKEVVARKKTTNKKDGKASDKKKEPKKAAVDKKLEAKKLPSIKK